MDLRWDNTLNKMEQLGKKYTRSPKVKLIQHENKSRHDSDEYIIVVITQERKISRVN